MKFMIYSVVIVIGATNLNGPLDTVVPNVASEATAMGEQLFPQIRNAGTADVGARVTIETINYRDIQ
jgi:hypothetical protein